MKRKFLVVVKVYEGYYDGVEACDVREVDMFSKWTDKRPVLNDLREVLT